MFEPEDCVHIQVVPPMLWMTKRLPRNCSALLKLGLASIV